MRTQLRNFIRCRHRPAPIGRFFRLETPANLGDSPEKPMYMRYLDDGQDYSFLSCTWDCLFRRQSGDPRRVSGMGAGSKWKNLRFTRNQKRRGPDSLSAAGERK